MCKGFSDITVWRPHEHPCVAVLFSFTFCGCALADSKFCFQFYQFNTTENEVGIKVFVWPDSTRGSPEGWLWALMQFQTCLLVPSWANILEKYILDSVKARHVAPCRDWSVNFLMRFSVILYVVISIPPFMFWQCSVLVVFTLTFSRQINLTEIHKFLQTFCPIPSVPYSLNCCLVTLGGGFSIVFCLLNLISERTFVLNNNPAQFS